MTEGISAGTSCKKYHQDEHKITHWASLRRGPAPTPSTRAAWVRLPSQRASVWTTSARSTSSTVESQMSSFGANDCAVFAGAAR
jgi:hypothetical protein